MFTTDYKYFLKVAKTSSFHKAAAELFVSQPAISKQIKLLEEEYGFPLFDRTTRKVSLTDEGKLLYHALRECEEIFENAKKSIVELHNSLVPAGVFRIGMVHGWSPKYFHIPFVETFQKRNEYVRMHYERHDHNGLIHELEENRLDVAVLSIQEVEHNTDISFSYLGRYHFKIVLAKSHPLAQYDYVLDKLDTIPLFTHTSSRWDTLNVQNVMEQNGIKSQTIVVPNMDSAFAAVENGAGYIIVLSCSNMCHHPDMRVYDFPAYLDLVVAYKNKTNDNLVAEFIKNLVMLQAGASSSVHSEETPGDRAR